MKLLYLDCGMGAAGDMLMAALWELLPERGAADFIEKMNSAGLPGVKISAVRAVKCGVAGTHMAVTVDGGEEHEEHGHHHHHTGLEDINALIGGLRLPEKVRRDAMAVYSLIAQAESSVHGQPVELVHFHEVGALDAAADVAGVCLLMDMLSPDAVAASPVHVGSGQVRCAHGLLPVPAPAAQYLLAGVPIYGGSVRGELCTPTGAALLKYFVQSFGAMPELRPERTGYGMGVKDFDAPNCVRAVLGEAGGGGDEIAELRCDLDDMTPEAVGFACEALFEAGALDVFTTPIGMKKSRPGVLLTCLCRLSDREKLAGAMFRHTTTLGIRETLCRRYILRRKTETRDTPRGPVRVKVAEGYGVRREKVEYEDAAEAARRHGGSVMDKLI